MEPTTDLPRAISLWQPWATLMTLEAPWRKLNETRIWATRYRGRS
jgi:hypothetical protein